MAYQMFSSKVDEAVDKEMATRKEKEQREVVKQRMEKLGQTDVLTAISPDDYDIEAAALESDFTEAAEGGIDLPNKYARNLPPMAGFDVNTGEKLWDEPDPNGAGLAGMNAVRNGVTNTKHGVPSDVYDGYFMLAMQGRQNGFSLSDMDLPLDQQTRQDMTSVLSRLDAYDLAESQLKAVDGKPGPQPDPEQRTLTQEDLISNPEFMNSAELMYKYAEPNGEPMSPDDLTSAAVREVAQTLSNEGKMGLLLMDLKSGDMDAETAQAWHNALISYDRLSPFDLDVMLGTGTGLVTSPLMVISGGLGKLMSSQASKTVGRSMLMGELEKYIASNVLKTASSRQVAKTAGAVAVAGALEGGTLGGLEDVTRQQVEINAGMREGIDWNRAGETALWSAGAGVVLGGGIGAAMSGPAREQVGRVVRTMINNHHKSSPKGAFATQRGSMSGAKPEDPSKTYLAQVIRGDVEPKGKPQGLPVDAKSFYSRARTNIFGTDEVSGNWSKAYGPKGNKKIAPEDVLEKIDAWKAGDPAKGVPSISAYELDNMGVFDYLRIKVRDGEGVTRDEIEDLMYARQPRFRLGMSDETGKVPAGMEPLPFANPDTVKERLSTFPLVMNLSRDVPVEQVSPDQLNIKDLKNPEEGLFAEGAFVWVDPMDQIERTLPIAGNTLDDVRKDIQESIRVSVNRMPQKARVKLAQELDQQMLIGNPIDLEKNWSLYSIGGEELAERGYYPENYRELRMFQDYNGGDPNTVAMDRWGKSYDELPDTGRISKERADRTASMYYDAASYNETEHFPLDINRLSAARLQDVWDSEGRKILFVNEMQSDISNAPIRHAPEKKIDPKVRADAVIKLLDMMERIGGSAADQMNKFLRDYDTGSITLERLEEVFYDNMKRFRTAPEMDNARKAFDQVKANFAKQKDLPEFQQTAGWQEAMLAQIFDLAAKDGYAGVAFPTVDGQVAKVQAWPKGFRGGKGVKNYYSTVLPRELKKSKMKKRLGINRIAFDQPLQLSEYEWDSVASDKGFTVYGIDPAKAAATPETPKPLYGALVAPTGVTFLGGEENE